MFLRARYNHWHGSPWHYEVDGVDYLIRETSTADPDHRAANSVFLPAKPFPEPLTWTWSVTRGADLTWVPIPFERSFRMAYSRTHYGTGYCIYHQYVPGTPLSRPLRSWTTNTAPDREVLEILSRAGGDLLPAPGSRESRRLHLAERCGDRVLAAGTATSLAKLAIQTPGAPREGQPGDATVMSDTPLMLRALQFTGPRQHVIEFGRARLRIVWDNAPQPSVDAPVALFFGTGTLYNRDNREHFVKAFPVNIHFDAENVRLACYFPMPFFHSARIELINPGDTAMPVRWSLRYQPYTDPPGHVGYFQTTYRDHLRPEPGKDLVLLDTRETEGGGDWSGQLVGTTWTFSDRAVLNTLEGDPRFFFDDSQTPQAYGTGTEEWGGGGDYWGGQNMTLPFVGHPTGARDAKSAKESEDQIESAYRFLLADLMPFGKNALIRLEHGGQNESTEHYQTVAFWYGRRHPSLIKTDELKIGEAGSEQAHQYSSPAATEPYSLTSRYEWGVDTLQGQEIFPAHTDPGRTTTGSSEFNLELTPENHGVLLRRKLDYQFPNQRAEVFVAKVKNGKLAGAFKPPGVWFLAGSSTCVYSNPKAELGAAQHIAQTSNRRFRDDEFLISNKLTQGRSEIRVRVRFIPVAVPLFPGYPLPELAWSELRYDAYCFVMPDPMNP